MITFPLALKTVSDYLDGCVELTGIPVLPRIPAGQRPNRFVVLSTAPASGPPNRVLSKRRIIAAGWAEKTHDAGVLTETVRSLIVDIIYHGLGVRKVTVIGEPAEFPHPTITDQFRWQLTADLLVRAEVS